MKESVCVRERMRESVCERERMRIAIFDFSSRAVKLTNIAALARAYEHFQTGRQSIMM